jgi:hypothetical protein
MDDLGVLHLSDGHSQSHSTIFSLSYIGVAMFQDLVARSDDCQAGQWKLDIHKVTKLARNKDRSTTATPPTPVKSSPTL